MRFSMISNRKLAAVMWLTLVAGCTRTEPMPEREPVKEAVVQDSATGVRSESKRAVDGDNDDESERGGKKEKVETVKKPVSKMQASAKALEAQGAVAVVGTGESKSEQFSIDKAEQDARALLSKRLGAVTVDSALTLYRSESGEEKVIGILTTLKANCTLIGATVAEQQTVKTQTGYFAACVMKLSAANARRSVLESLNAQLSSAEREAFILTKTYRTLSAP